MPTQTTPLRDLLTRLRTVGEKPPRKLFDAIREHGQDAVAPLIEVVNDYPRDEPDAAERRYWAAYHAMRLLGDLHAAEAVEPLLALLDEEDDWIEGYLPESLGQIGRPAIEPLRAALFAPDADVYGVTRAANALVRLAELHPEHWAEIVDLLIERFDADVPSDEPDAVRGFLVSDLADLRAVEAIPTVRRAFGENLVDETIIDLETFRLIVERPEGVSASQALRPKFARTGSSSLLGGLTPGLTAAPDELATESRRPQPFGRKVGRNEACPCGSGLKYKRCHGR